MRKRWLGILGCVFLLCFCLLNLAGCEDGTNSTPNNTTSSTSKTSTGATEAVCAQVRYKLACLSIIRRYEYLNDANKYGYFYGFVQGTPEPVIEYVVQGSVFPTSDLISNPTYQERCTGYASESCAVVLDKQQPDGTYGTNGQAMFGWRADGAYFEWEGPYAYSQTPLSFKNVKVVGCKAGVPGC